MKVRFYPLAYVLIWFYDEQINISNLCELNQNGC